MLKEVDGNSNYSIVMSLKYLKVTMGYVRLCMDTLSHPQQYHSLWRLAKADYKRSLGSSHLAQPDLLILLAVSRQTSWPCFTKWPPFSRRHCTCIFANENVKTSIKISLKFVPKGPINNIPALVQIMAWRRPGDNPLSEPMMVSLSTHICVTPPQWVN